MAEKPRSIDEITSKGAYIMYLLLKKNKRGLKVGSLKIQDFDSGLFAYVGSAYGPGGLRGRLRRYLKIKRRHSNIHWHIDHIIVNPDSKILGFHVLEGASEHQVAKEIEKLAKASFKGFGCSDCHCYSHFFYLGRGVKAIRKVEEELRNCGQITSIIFISSNKE